MDLTQMTCDRELAEEMARLNLCQNRAELFWICQINSNEWTLRDSESKHYEGEIIAPTLPRMFEELPEGWDVEKVRNGYHCCPPNNFKSFTDAKLGNALSRALIEIAKRKG